MFLRHLCSFEWLSFKSFGANIRGKILLWGFLYILLCLLVGMPVLQIGNEFEYDDLPLMEASLVTGGLGYLLLEFSSLSFPPSIKNLSWLCEYLLGHIGEKRPAGDSYEFRNLLSSAQLTALFYGAVFFNFFARGVDREIRRTRVFLLILIGPFRPNYFFMEVCLHA